ncbi:RusA-like Holliday junction resolvase [Orpheovirus IHUMI-LCC2]|uniref:Crossover junction endodeoxyribonuclease RusA n=1 Tax=Orpheovirus IHUMI-LCC2 TaxID=2023057 RepID=A0A2I2L3K7_9VIRU|nr:RusA-like Holliday junction resolvase [Orpheovirus IHUMI-LCC2]SNW62125.1 Crossover junction endodeoxyribonuclease RusA [Orpheovirus IHUMI-LCC2]
MNYIFIPGNVPSSKNSKQWTGKMLINSKATQLYIRESQPYFMQYKEKFKEMCQGKEKPYKVVFKFIRNSRHKFDYINPCQTIQDLMTKYEWIEDDNCDEIIPYFDQYLYDKENPGVYISII